MAYTYVSDYTAEELCADFIRLAVSVIDETFVWRRTFFCGLLPAVLAIVLLGAKHDAQSESVICENPVIDAVLFAFLITGRTTVAIQVIYVAYCAAQAWIEVTSDASPQPVHAPVTVLSATVTPHVYSALLGDRGFIHIKEKHVTVKPISGVNSYPAALLKQVIPTETEATEGLAPGSNNPNSGDLPADPTTVERHWKDLRIRMGNPSDIHCRRIYMVLWFVVSDVCDYGIAGITPDESGRAGHKWNSLHVFLYQVLTEKSQGIDLGYYADAARDLHLRIARNRFEAHDKET